MDEPSEETVVLEYAGKLRNVPASQAEAAMRDGFRPVSQEEIEIYDAKKKYEAETSPVVQAAQAFGTGVAEGALSVPALVSNVLPGVENQSAGSWIAAGKAKLQGITQEEAERDLRIIAEASPGWTFAGDVAGSLAGSGGAIGLGKVAGKQLIKKGGKLADVLGSKGAQLTGITAENIVSSNAMANEEAFRHNQELTSEMMVAATIFGGGAPLALKFTTQGVAAGGRKLAGKVDDFRMARHEQKLAAHGRAVEAVEAEADDIFSQQVGKQSAQYEKAYDKAAGAYEKTVSKEVEKRAASLRRQSAAQGVKNPVIRTDDIEAAVRKERPFVPPEHTGPSPTRPVVDPMAPPEAPVLFQRLFGGKNEATGALEQMALRAEKSAQSADKTFQRHLSNSVSRQARREAREHMGLGSIRDYTYGARGIRGRVMAFDTLVAPMVGTVATKLVEQYGPRASGMFFNGLAASMRTVAKASAAMGSRGTKGISPLQAIVGVGNRAVWRQKVSDLFDRVDQQVAEQSANTEAMIQGLAETYGEYADVNQNVMPAVASQYARMLEYANAERPRSVPMYPGAPQLGMIRPPLDKQESYVRKMLAVQNPMLLLQELQNGDVTRDTVEAVSAVYPTLYSNMVLEVMTAISERTEALSRQEEAVLSTFLSRSGVPFGSQTPSLMARMATVYQQQSQPQVEHRGGGGGAEQGRPGPARKPGAQAGSPSLAQSMKTGSQRSTDSIYN
jgi:hypothetical protein